MSEIVRGSEIVDGLAARLEGTRVEWADLAGGFYGCAVTRDGFSREAASREVILTPFTDPDESDDLACCWPVSAAARFSDIAVGFYDDGGQRGYCRLPDPTDLDLAAEVVARWILAAEMPTDTITAGF